MLHYVLLIGVLVTPKVATKSPSKVDPEIVAILYIYSYCRKKGIIFIVIRRLQDVVLTGIYECNKTCKCSTTCVNRLVQFPIRSRLQIFRTSSCGWGIRTLDDLPQGAFIATYVGKLYGPEEGNAQGKIVTNSIQVSCLEGLIFSDRYSN